MERWKEERRCLSYLGRPAAPARSQLPRSRAPRLFLLFLLFLLLRLLRLTSADVIARRNPPFPPERPVRAVCGVPLTQPLCGGGPREPKARAKWPPRRNGGLAESLGARIRLRRGRDECRSPIREAFWLRRPGPKVPRQCRRPRSYKIPAIVAGVLTHRATSPMLP